jgi:hypothetical protein
MYTRPAWRQPGDSPTRLAERLDAVRRPLGIDDGVHHVVRRASSAAATNALALGRLSLARVRSRFSRSSASSRSRSPGAVQLSLGNRCIQWNRSLYGSDGLFAQDAVEQTHGALRECLVTGIVRDHADRGALAV